MNDVFIRLLLKMIKLMNKELMGFLRRNLALTPRHTKEVAYKTLVRPKLEYAAPIDLASLS